MQAANTTSKLFRRMATKFERATSHNDTVIYSLALSLTVPLRRSSLPALLRLAASSAVSSTGAPPLSWAAIASSKSFRPTASASVRTRVLTVAPSRRFLPSRLLEAILSTNSHSLPDGTSCPVAGSRDGVHSGVSRSRAGTLVSLDLISMMMPSSLKRWNAFFNDSLLTASK